MRQLDCVVGLGSNLGDRVEHMRAGVRELGRLGHLSSVSGLYESLPVGGPPQPPFLNAAVRMSTELAPAKLLEKLLAAESREGRMRRGRWGPRTLDLDILWIRGMRIATTELIVPHPRLAERAFALVPMLEVAPDAVDPVDGSLFADRRAQLDDSGMVLAGPRSAWVSVALR